MLVAEFQFHQEPGQSQFDMHILLVLVYIYLWIQKPVNS